MVIWLALFIPVLAAIAMFIFFRRKFIWWELFIPVVACLIFIAIFKLTCEKVLTNDVEYRGGIIMGARYVEPYTTWVRKTCSRSYKCGKSTCTTYYDCSYCDYNRETYYTWDNLGNTYTITSTKYQELKQQWLSTPKFIELNRNIKYYYNCGKDGDAYEIYWNKDANTSESSTFTNSYENRIQAAHSAFSYEDLDDDLVDSLKLFKYPEINDFYKQRCILGIDNLYSVAEIKTINRNFEYLNGYYSPINKIKVFVLVYHNKHRSIANHQEAYWDGGNDNELIITMSIDPKTKEIQWVKPFSWTPNRRCIVECREEISELKTFDPYKIFNILSVVSLKYYKARDFKEFSYVTVEPPTWEVIATYIITILITVGTIIWGYSNEFTNEETSINLHKRN